MKKSNTQEDHLNEFTRQFIDSLAGQDVEQRIRLLQSESWIGYDSALRIVSRIEGLIKMPRLVRMHSLLVMGATDNGKTSIRKRIEEKYHHYATQENQLRFPVVSIQMPPDPDARSFYNALLKGVMQPKFHVGKIDSIRDMVAEIFQELEVRLLMIDEVQHIDRMPALKQRSILDSMKYLSNELSLPMVAFGTAEALNVFSADPQLKNRFKKIYLPKWEPNDDFRRLLSSVERLLPLKEPSRLSDEDLALLIYSKTNGTIGEISLLLRHSAIKAIESGEEKITGSVVEAVNFESIEYEFGKNENPV